MNPHRLLSLYLILLAAIIVDSYLDRSALSYAVMSIQKDFALNNTQFGLLTSVFAAGYLVMTFVGGMLVDRFGACRILSLSTLFWSLSIIFVGLSQSFIMLLFSRLLLGMAEGPGFPAYTRVMADNLSLAVRVRTTSLGLAAVPFASVIGAPLVSQLIVHWQWRLTFVMLGIGGVVLAGLWFAIYRDPIKTAPTATRAKMSWHDLRLLLSNRDLLLNNFGCFAYAYTLFFAISWLPAYLIHTYQLDLKAVGWFLTLPWIVGTIMLLTGGWLSDYLWRRFHSLRIARSLLIWLSLLLSAASFVLVIIKHTLLFSLLGISLGVGFCLLPNAICYALNMDLAHKYAATSMGIMNACFALAGIISPLLTGLLSHITGNFYGAIGLLIVLNLTAALAIAIWQRPSIQEST